MIQLKTKNDVERYVRKLKNFYGEFSLFILIVAIALVIYNLSAGDTFWPIWIILTWGTVLFLKASKLHIINPNYYHMAHGFREKLPFIQKDWETEKIEEILKKTRISTTTKKAPLKKAVSKKTPIKKSTKHKAKK